MQISRSDIESVIADTTLNFDEDDLAAITCLDSADIQACPGSGKTTCLVTKLLVIERSLPLASGAGICVLTHTNAAIDEVKARASATSLLFREPNYVGTIQTFVDRYLAIPAYTALFGRRPAAIDAERFDIRMRREYKKLKQDDKKSFIPFRNGAWGTEQDGMEKFLSVRAGYDGEATIYTEGLSGKTYARDPSTARFRVLERVRQAIQEDGILHYDDAYSLATRYLQEHPCLPKLFQLRFRYLFIDEMQDTAPHQAAILNTLFGNSIVVQRFGDRNQTIYEGASNTPCWTDGPRQFALSSSRRLSNTIAKAVRHVCQKPHARLTGHDRTAIPPQVLVFKDENVTKVLPVYVKLVQRFDLASTTYPLKAIGRVGAAKQQTQRHTISSYFPSFEKARTNSGRPYTLHGHLLIPHSTSAEPYLRAIVAGIEHALDLVRPSAPSVPRLNRQSLCDYVSKSHPLYYTQLRASLVRWCRALYEGEDVTDEVRDHIVGELLPLFGLKPANIDPTTMEFLEQRATPPGTPDVPVPIKSTNVYKGGTSGHTVVIEIDTVHSCKGQTHTATLYLETFYKTYDVWEILPLIVDPSAVCNSRLSELLPLAYVAMTRPTDLLCVALHRENGKESFDDSVQTRLQRAGWDVVDVDSFDLADPTWSASRAGWTADPD